MKTTDDKDLIVHLETLSIMDNIINIQQSMTDSINLIVEQHNLLINQPLVYVVDHPINIEIELSGNDSSDSFDQPED
jgi:hypothetical protein